MRAWQSFLRRVFGPLTAPRNRSKRSLRLEMLEERTVLTATPTATLSAPSTVLIGGTANFTATFTNTGTNTGYAPYVDLFLDTTGADGGASPDGFDLSIFSAIYLGQPLPSVTIVPIGAGNQYVNPLTGQTFTAPGTFQPGDAVAVLQLPFGSFTSGQPAVPIAISIGTKNFANVGFPLPVAAEAGFALGLDPLNNPGVDPPLRQAGFASSTVTPELFTLTKTYLGPEDETASGPNYKRDYRLDVTVAPGQTITNLDVTDQMPGTEQFTQVISTLLEGAATATTAISTPSNATPGGTLTRRFASVTGSGDGSPDASMTFEFFVTRDTNGNPATPTIPQGTDQTFANNTGNAQGHWNPLDPRDPQNQTVTQTLPVNAHTLDQQSITTQKMVSVVNTGASVIPGQTILRYDIDFQVSDYFAFENVFLQDILSDGQRLYLAPGFAPTLSVNGAYLQGALPSRANSATAAFGGANTIGYQQQFTTRGTPLSDPTTPPSGPVFNIQAAAPSAQGSTFLQFNISQELIARGFSGELVGGNIANAGGAPQTGGPAGYGSLFGPTTGHIVFFTEVKNQYSDNFPSGDAPLDEGDSVSNAVPLIQGDQLNTTTINNATPTVIGTGTDDSAASIAINRGVLSKQIYAVNGVVLPAPLPTDPPISVQPGDRVTYRLSYTLPISSAEDLNLIDFPPLPVFPVGAAASYTLNLNAAPTFAAFEIARGPSDDFSGAAGGYFSTFGTGSRTPTISTDTTANSITLDFGTFNDIPLHRSTTIDMLVTLPVGTQPFASDLFLTNQLRVSESNTASTEQNTDAIRMFNVVRPVMTIAKGVVGDNNTGLSFNVGGSTIAFAAPTAGSSFTVTGGANANIDTAAEAAAIGASNLLNVPDANDTIRYAIVAQDTDKGDAFNTVIADQIQPAYVKPATAAGLNLVVRRGNGKLLTLGTDYALNYDNATGAFSVALIDNFDNLNDPAFSAQANQQTIDTRLGGLSRGQSDLGAITDGSNTIVVTYDLTLVPTVNANQTIVNTATVTQYAASPGGGNLTDPAVVPGATQPTDTATVTIHNPTIVKTLVGTSVTEPGNNAANQAVIGELLTYQVVLTVSEGVTPSASILDTLDGGLAFVDVQSVALSTGLTTSNGLADTNSAAVNLASLNSNTTSPAGPNGGGTVTFNFGTITNSTNDNATPETITIVYRAVVLDSNTAGANNQAGALRNNQARVHFTGEPAAAIQSSAPNVTIVEPTLAVNKQVSKLTTGAAFAALVSGDAGDTVQYRITITNANAAADTTAFGVTLNDLIPSFITGATIFSATSTGNVRLNGTAGAVGTGAFQLAANTLTFDPATNIDMEKNSSITVVIQGTFTGSTGQTTPNTADVRWTSLDGNVSSPQSAFNTRSVERTGQDGNLNSGVLNDYRVLSTATIESPPLIFKSVVATSEGSTNGSNVAVGEVVRYRLVTTLGEGLTRNFQLQDRLPTGMAFLNDGSARYAFISTGGSDISSATIAGLATGLGTAGGINGTNTVLPLLTSFTTPGPDAVAGTFNDDNIATSFVGSGTGDPAVYNNGQGVFFRFGDLTNADNDVDNEYVVVEFNALVLNVAGNQAGTTLNNDFTVLADTDGNGTTGYLSVVRDNNKNGVRDAGDVAVAAIDANNDAGSGSDTPAFSTPAPVNVVEPNLSIAKTVTPTSTDANGAVTFTVVLSAGNGANDTTAFDVLLDDPLPAGFQNVAIAGATTTTGTVTGVGVPTVTGNTVDLSVDSMAPGSTVTFQITANVNNNLQSDPNPAPLPGTTITNTATATFTSLPGTTGTTTNPTGSATPGAASSATGERTGSDGPGNVLNNYSVTGSAGVTIFSNSIAGEIYQDLNDNGVRDGGEALITGQPIIVQLSGTDHLGNPVNLGTTTSTGTYSFTGLRPGTYTVTEFTQPAGFLDGLDTPGTNFGGTGTAATDQRTPRDADAISSVTIGLVGNKSGINYDFGELPPASIGDFVWHDLNGNGRQDAGEPGIDGVAVTLNGTDDTGRTVLAATTTAGGGAYNFGNLRPGTYSVTFGNTAAGVTYTRTIQNSSAAIGTNNSDGDPVTGQTASFGLVAGQNQNAIDQGLYLPVNLGDHVWYDVNGSGTATPDAGEPGIPNVGVQLFYAGPDGVFGTIDDPVGPVDATTTNGTGDYLFTGKIPGTYRVQIVAATLPNGLTTPTFDRDGIATPNVGTAALTSGNDDLNFDFSYRASASLGDRVWLDANGNGVQDVGEPGIPGVQVTATWLGFDGVLGGGDDVTYTTTTDTINGNYLFSNLPAGKYVVSVNPATLPANFVQTFDLNGPLDNSATRTLAVNENAVDVDFGYRGQASVGDRVWDDANGNGVQDPGEPGVLNAAVQLRTPGPDGVLNTADDIVFTTTTNAAGNYLFSGVPVYTAADTMRVTVTSVPAEFTTQTYDLDGLGTPNQADFTLAPTQNRVDVDFGYRGNGSLAGDVYVDTNNNGTIDATEPPIANVLVTLTGLDSSGNTLTESTTTNALGAYSFTGLIPGTYSLAETQPIAFADGLDTRGTINGSANGTTTNDLFSNLVLGAGQSGINYNFGERGATLSGSVFVDGNQDGVQQVGEAPIPNVLLTLTGTDVNNNPVSVTAMTNASGFYVFTNLPAANVTGYTVTETQPTGYGNSTGTPSTVRASIPVPAGANVTNQNFGETVGSIAGSVYVDTNNDGIRQIGEPGIGGVGLQLIDVATGLTAGLATTQPDGSYSFTNLLAGTYRINETQPAAYADGRETVGTSGGVLVPTDTIDNIPLNPGINATGYNFGELASSIAGIAYYDKNQDGVYQPATDVAESNLLITLRDAGNNVIATALTKADGSYLFPNLPAGNYTVSEQQPVGYGSSEAPTNTRAVALGVHQNVIGQNFGDTLGTIAGVVYIDRDLNGSFNPAAPAPADTGITGITVRLLDVNGTVIRTTTTIAGGTYQFTDLPTGTYTVVETLPPLPNHQLMGFYDGADNLGSLNGTRPAKNQLRLTLGLNAVTQVSQNGLNYNFGELPPADPNGFVYIDFNNNGHRNPGEPGIPNVRITLSGIVRVVNPDGTTGTRALVAADVPGGLVHLTDATGFYDFAPIPSGTYSLVETQPAGFADGLEENGDPNLPAPIVTNDRFDNIVLSPFQVRGPFNFGELASSGSIAGSVFVDPNNNSLRDPGELGIPGVVVRLTGRDLAGVNVNVVVVTDANGNYVFNKMRPGTYQLTETQPVAFVDGLDRVGTAGGTAGNDVLTNIVLGPNVAATGYIFGERGLTAAMISKRFFLSSTTIRTLGIAGSGVAFVNNAADPSGFVYFDRNENGVRDPGEEGIAGVQLLLTGTTSDGGSMLLTQWTNADGFYQFDQMPAGVYSIREVQPAGYRTGRTSVGTLGGVARIGAITQIVVAADANGIDYNFGEWAARPALPNAAAIVLTDPIITNAPVRLPAQLPDMPVVYVPRLRNVTENTVPMPGGPIAAYGSAALASTSSVVTVAALPQGRWSVVGDVSVALSPARGSRLIELSGSANEDSSPSNEEVIPLAEVLGSEESIPVAAGQRIPAEAVETAVLPVDEFFLAAAENPHSFVPMPDSSTLALDESTHNRVWQGLMFAVPAFLGVGTDRSMRSSRNRKRPAGSM